MNKKITVIEYIIYYLNYQINYCKAEYEYQTEKAGLSKAPLINNGTSGHRNIDKIATHMERIISYGEMQEEYKKILNRYVKRIDNYLDNQYQSEINKEMLKAYFFKTLKDKDLMKKYDFKSKKDLMNLGAKLFLDFERYFPFYKNDDYLLNNLTLLVSSKISPFLFFKYVDNPIISDPDMHDDELKESSKEYN